MTEPAEYQPARGGSPGVAHVLTHLGELAAAMRERLDACQQKRDDPEVEAVHRLRTGARRVEAVLEMLARQAGGRGLGEGVEEARQRWLRQLKKVRRAAGAVRDLDVHRKLLADNFLPPDKTAGELTEVMAAAEGSEKITLLAGAPRA
jgi:CHAD domain-containing protein